MSLAWFLSSCERKLEPPKETPTGRAFIYRYKFQRDDTLYDGANLLLTQRWTEFRTTMALRKSLREYAFNMNSLPPSFRGPWDAQLLWVNDKFVSLLTNWDGPFGDRLYLPLDSAGKIQHFQKYSIDDDSLGSNAFIIESTTWAPIGQIRIQNLITGKIDSLSYMRDSTFYPYYRSLECNSGMLIVETNQGIFRKDIRHLSR